MNKEEIKEKIRHIKWVIEDNIYGVVYRIKSKFQKPNPKYKCSHLHCEALITDGTYCNLCNGDLEIKNYDDLYIELSNLLVYSKKHGGWVITKEDITKFDIEHFTRVYAKWVYLEPYILDQHRVESFLRQSASLEDINNYDDIDYKKHMNKRTLKLIEHQYEQNNSLKGLSAELKTSALEMLIRFLQNDNNFTSSIKDIIKEYKTYKNTAKYKGIVNEKDIIPTEYLEKIEQLEKELKEITK